MTQHVLETFKYSYAERTKLGDPRCEAPGCDDIGAKINEEQEKLLSWVIFYALHMTDLSAEATSRCIHALKLYFDADFFLPDTVMIS